MFNIPTSTFSWYNPLFYSLRRRRSTLVLTGLALCSRFIVWRRANVSCNSLSTAFSVPASYSFNKFLFILVSLISVFFVGFGFSFYYSCWLFKINTCSCIRGCCSTFLGNNWIPRISCIRGCCSHTFNLSFLLLTVTHFLEIIEFLEFLEYAIPGISSCMFLYNSEKCLCRGLVSLLIRGILNLSSLHTPKLFLTSLSSV